MDIVRYSRLLQLKGIGAEGMERIRNGSVLVIGCGALGSMCAMYLAASGVGTIGIADFDTIDISNLQRQLFFDENTLGKPKCAVLAERMKSINGDVNVIEYPCLIDRVKAGEIFRQYDFIVDGSDNPATKSMTSEVCESLGQNYCIGGVREFAGQVMSWAPGHTLYSELFGDVRESCSGVLPCSVSGVLGPAAGVTASVQAAEAIKYLAGCGRMLYDRLFTFDLAEPTSNVFAFQ